MYRGGVYLLLGRGLPQETLDGLHGGQSVGPDVRSRALAGARSVVIWGWMSSALMGADKAGVGRSKEWETRDQGGDQELAESQL